MMKAWTERPTELAHLLNPAFNGAVMRTALDGYVDQQNTAMPFELAFLVLPICLHPATASRLPTDATKTPLHAWLQREENRDVLVSFADRVLALLPYTREALVFAAQRGVVEFDDSGAIRPGTVKWPKLTSYSNSFRNSGEEVKEAIRRAEFVGRWFALAGTTTTIFTILGVQP